MHLPTAGADRVRQVCGRHAGQVGHQARRQPRPRRQNPGQAPAGPAARREGHQAVEAGHGPPHAASQTQARHDGVAARRGTFPTPARFTLSTPLPLSKHDMSQLVEGKAPLFLPTLLYFPLATSKWSNLATAPALGRYVKAFQ